VKKIKFFAMTHSANERKKREIEKFHSLIDEKHICVLFVDCAVFGVVLIQLTHTVRENEREAMKHFSIF
jgi:hypothetical protein